MNKALIGLLVLSALLVSQTIAEDVKCKDHPLYQKAKAYIKDAVKDISKGAEKAESLLKVFEDATAEVQTAEDLGVCSQFAGQKTCCNKNIVHLLDKAAFVRTGGLNKRNSAIKKSVNVAFKILKRKNCDKAKNLSIPDLYNNAKLTKLKDLLAAQKQCKVDFAKAISQITRGAMCSICAGVEKLTDYIQDGKLKISQDSLTAFQTASENAITCVANNLTQTKLKDVIDQIVTEYVDDTCTDKTIDVSALSLKVLDKINVNSKKDNGDKKCSGTIVFSSNEDCESGLEGNSAVETDADSAKRMLREERLLATDDAVVASSGGVNVFISSTTDNNISEDGNINIEFDDDVNSAFKLAFAAIISLFALLL